jgi:hypothetical protein
MRKLIGLLLAVFCAAHAWGQYHVLHVQGQVEVQSTGDAPAVGTKLNDTDRIAFRSPDAQVFVWVEGKGRQLLAPPSDSPPGPKSARMPLEKAMRPSKTYPHYPLQAKVRTQADFQAHFDRPYLLLPGTAVPVDTRDYPISKESALFLRFLQTPLDAEVPTRLPVRNDSLLLNPAQFLDMNGVKVEPQDASDFSICHLQLGKKYLWISDFRPVYVSAQLRTALDLLRACIDAETDPQFRQGNKKAEELYGFVCEAYGVPDWNTFLIWAGLK